MNILNKIVSLFKTKTDSNSVKPDSKKMLVSEELKNFLEDEVLDGLDINSDHFWSSLENIINEFAPRNKELLSKDVIILFLASMVFTIIIFKKIKIGKIVSVLCFIFYLLYLLSLYFSNF